MALLKLNTLDDQEFETYLARKYGPKCLGIQLHRETTMRGKIKLRPIEEAAVVSEPVPAPVAETQAVVEPASAHRRSIGNASEEYPMALLWSVTVATDWFGLVRQPVGS